MRGVISARILQEIEETVKKKHGQKLHEYFDLIAGTSTGSILAAGIACGMSAEQLIHIYEKRGQDIFLESVRWQRNFRWLSRFLGGNVLYPHEVKGLVQVFKEWVINKLYPDEVKNKDFREKVINKRYPDKVKGWRKWVIIAINILPHKERPGKRPIQVFKEKVIDKLYPDEVLNKLYPDEVKDKKFKDFKEDVINKRYPDEVKGWKKWVINVINILPHKKRSEKGLANVLKEKLKLHKNGKVVNNSPTMADIEKPQLLILAYDVSSRYTKWFANDDSTEWWYDNTKLWEICTASASAPTFFPPRELYNPETKKYLPHIDGGVSANNPTVAAIAHALCIKEDDENRNTKIKKPNTIDEITVLSIGTGQTTHRYTYEKVKKWGLAKWAMHIPDIFLDPSAENSEHISMRTFLGIKPENYLRLNFKLGDDVDDKVDKESAPGKNEDDNLTIKEDKNINGFKNTFEISQNIDIDNPDICKILTKASEVYLCDGDVYYDKSSNEREKVKVKDAIKKFFDNVKQQDENQLAEVCSECSRRVLKPMHE